MLKVHGALKFRTSERLRLWHDLIDHAGDNMLLNVHSKFKFTIIHAVVDDRHTKKNNTNNSAIPYKLKKSSSRTLLQNGKQWRRHDLRTGRACSRA